MLVVTHKHTALKLVHVSTHQEGGRTKNWPTKTYVTKARWAHDNHRTSSAAQHNYDDGFQVALIATGLDASAWEDTVEVNDDPKGRRKEILQELEGQGWTNVGSTRTKTIRSLLTGLVGNNGWGKEYNKPMAKMRSDFQKLVDLLKLQGRNEPQGLFMDVYKANATERGLDGIILRTKGEVFEYIIQRMGVTF